MSRRAWWLCSLALVALVSPGWAGQASQTAMTTRAVPARREGNMVLVSGRPNLLLWAAGLEDPAQVDEYRAAGFNTVYLGVASAAEDGLAAASALADAAEEAGLIIVVCLAPARLEDGEGNDLAIAPGSDEYVAAVGDFVHRVVRQLGDHDRLIAWSVAAVPPERVAWGDEGFRAQLQEWYGSLEALNRSWGSELPDWEAVTTAVVREIDSTFPGGLGRASVDYACYREEVYADTLSVWAEALHAADPGRLVFASALPDYRSVISVRADFDGLVLNTYPSAAEPDNEAHNAHAVDMARRGNQFAAIPMLEIRFGADAEAVARWANAALLHGAAGVAFSSWPNVRESEAVTGVVRKLADLLTAGPAFPQRPLVRAAILYQPIAGGRMRDGRGLYGYLDGVTPGEPTALFWALGAGTRYGQVDVLASSSLAEVDLGQYGVIFAPMALYLTDEAQLALQTYVLRGGALVADSGIGMYQAAGTITSVPTVMQDMFGLRYADLSEPEVEPGTIVEGAPGGAGEPGQLGRPGVAPRSRRDDLETIANPDVRRFVDILQTWLGRREVATYLGSELNLEGGPRFRVRDYGRGFAVYVPTFLYENWDSSDARFADFHAGLLSRRADVEMIGPGEDGIYARPGPPEAAAEEVVEPDSATTIPTVDLPAAEGVPDVVPGEELAAPYAGESGLGPDQPVGPPPVVELPGAAIEPPALPEAGAEAPLSPTASPVAPYTPPTAGAPARAPAVQLWPPGSAAVYEGWTLGVSSPGGQSVVVDAYDAGNQMYLIPGGAMRLANPDEEARVELVFPGAPLALVAPIPVYLRPRGEGAIVTAAVVRYDSGGIELVVNGTEARLVGATDGFGIVGGVATPVEIEIRSGAYRVTAGSMHRVVVKEGARQTPQSEQVVMPNPETGSLMIEASVRWTRMVIEPAPEQEE